MTDFRCGRWGRTSAALLSTVGIFLLSACGGSGQSAGPQSGPRTVTGVMNLGVFTDAGLQVAPADTTKIQVAALVPSGGGYRSIVGQPLPNGEFKISGVPAGNYLLQLGSSTFALTDSSTPDIGFLRLGRIDAQRPTQPTQLTLSVTGANPMQANDAIQIYVSNTSGYGLWYGTSLGAIPAGATSFTRTLPWSDYLTDAAKGDKANVFQMAAQQAGAYQVQVVRKAAQVTFTQTDGSNTPVPVALTDLPDSGIVHLAFQGTAFAQLERGVNPNATEFGTFLYLDALSGQVIAAGKVGSTPDLVTYLNTNGPIAGDVDLGSINFFNPYPQMDLFFDAEQQVKMTYQVPGAVTPYVAYPGIRVTIQTQAPDRAPAIAPLVGPATTPLINGASFFADQSGVGVTPTIAWSPPQLGVATAYQLNLAHLFADANGIPQAEVVAAFITTGNSVILPGNLLVPGNHYLLALTAISDPNIDSAVSPFRFSMPRGTATALSGIITP